MVRSTVAVVCLLWSTVVAEDSRVYWHLRALDPWAAESLDRGLTNSRMVATLAHALESSDVIVHIDSSTRLGAGLGGTTRFVGRSGNSRYVRITLHRDLAPDVRAATLAHELQHAVELAQSTAESHTAMQQLFERIGYRIDPQRLLFETEAATRAGARAWTELRQRCGGSSCTRDTAGAVGDHHR